MPDDALRRRVQQALDFGELLPIEGQLVGAGREGRGLSCNVCRQPIGPYQTALEVASPQSAVVHPMCYKVWAEESEVFVARRRDERRSRSLQ
jgi:hypothetical protein